MQSAKDLKTFVSMNQTRITDNRLTHMMIPRVNKDKL